VISNEKEKLMKRLSAMIMMTMMVFVLSVGLSWGYETQKASGGLTIVLSTRSYPLATGDNALNVKVTDASGKAVTDAKVSIRFFMPPMPGMAPMSSTVQAQPAGDAYPFTANVAMAGTWKAEVSVARPGKPPVTAIFNLDAR
jgi:hypothetical protein